jgi:hypothetical protein
MQSKNGFFTQKPLSTVVDLTNSSQENSQLLVNPSIQDEPTLIQGNNWSAAKQFTKGFLDQANSTALGGAVLVNYVIIALTMMGHKFTNEDHKHLETLLLSCWGLRGGVAGLLAVTGLKNKAPDAIAVYSLTERNVIKMLAIASFLRKMPITFSINSALQIASAIMVVMDQGLSVKALVEDKADPSGFSYPEIKEKYQGQSAVIALLTAKEIISRFIPMAATTYTAGNALADVFKDADSPVDPANQQQILMILALAMAILAALSVIHPITSQIASQIRFLEINIGLVFLPLVSLMFDYLPQEFTSHSTGIGVIALILVGVLPSIVKAIDSVWSYQDKLEVKVKPQDEIRTTVEDLIEEKKEYRCDF